MKKFVFLSLFFILIFTTGISGQNNESAGKDSKQGSLQLMYSPELFPLVKNFYDEYALRNPGLKITLEQITTSKDFNKNSGNTLYFITGNELQESAMSESQKTLVARDVIVPVINAGNPLISVLKEQGVSPEKLLLILEQQVKMNWNSLLKNVPDIPVNFYWIDNSAIQHKVELFLKKPNIALRVIKVNQMTELVSSVQKDPNAIGFCRLADIQDPQSQDFVSNIALLPIDKNGNGKIDYMEDIYENSREFTRGVWVGKYPKALYDNIYSLSGTANAATTSFLKWILTDGQISLSKTGYSNLYINERQTELSSLENTGIIVTETSKPFNSVFILLIIILAGVLLAAYIVYLAICYFRIPQTAPMEKTRVPVAFNENSINVPRGLYYDKTHTWVFMEENGTLRTGIDDFLLHVTGQINRIEMKQPGDKIRKGEKFMTIIREGKKLNLYAPVSGTITALNDVFSCDLSAVNLNASAEGWIYKIDPSDWMYEISFLNMAEKYKAWLKNEFSRLKDFVAFYLNTHSFDTSQVVLQDGGELKDNFLADLEPEIWEDFQTKFIDSAK